MRPRCSPRLLLAVLVSCAAGLLAAGAAATAGGARGGPVHHRRASPARSGAYPRAPHPSAQPTDQPPSPAHSAALDSPPSGAGGAALQAALKMHRAKMAETLSEKIEQSSAVFKDFDDPPGPGWEVPSTGDGKGVVERGPGCDPRNFSFSDESDAACIWHLAANTSWVRLKPMYAILSDARTIKFRVTLRADQGQAIVKLPQYKFMFEPYAELMAFHADRLLGLYRVPPVVWTLVPADWFRAAAAVSMPAFYVQWLERYVLSRRELHDAVRPWPQHWTGSMPGLWVSAQLWMHGVKHLRSTAVQPPPSYSQLLDPSSGWWPPPRGSLGLWQLGELSDLFLFDFIIGNSDRTVSKNAFAVGSCNSVSAWDCSEGDGVPEARRPRMVYVDQGSSFYGMDGPRRSPLRSSAKRGNSTVCRFRRRTAERVFRLRGDALRRGLVGRIPRGSGFWSHARKWQPEGAQKRLQQVAQQLERCLAKFGGAAVYPFGI
eukprot:TRINITY_DN11991_c0_g1_i1.p1 TRINITY_DN11991_c0_g1~~TRINITY_DN11991_c0_g1_i1.p1  ORF type:complete len:488 (+),score=134.24 TRINITY_DN11991_c0_g1_i1:89-1552(+)